MSEEKKRISIPGGAAAPLPEITGSVKRVGKLQPLVGVIDGIKRGMVMHIEFMKEVN
ncbi:MAG: hypothetical protein WCI95_11310 [bacterium]